MGKMGKHIKYFVVVFVLVLFFALCFVFANMLINKSYSSSDIISGGESVLDEGETERVLNGEDSTEEIILNYMEFSDDSEIEDGGYAFPLRLYDEDDLENRMENYLGVDYGDYSEVIRLCQKYVEDGIMEGLSYDYSWDNKTGEESVADLYGNDDQYTAEELKEYDLVRSYSPAVGESGNKLKVVGMFDGNYIVYAPYYPDNKYNILFVVDYSMTPFMYNDLEFDFGSAKGLEFFTSNSVYKNMGDFDVFFIKNDPSKFFDADGNMYTAEDIKNGFKIEWE